MNVATAVDPGESRRAPTRGAAIEIRSLTKAFGAKSVLHKVDLTVPPGQFVVIVGRSGCGKTTLLRLVAGLETPDGGAIKVEGGASAIRVMFQEPRLLPWATVHANVRLGFGRDRDSAEAGEKSREALGRVGLGEKAGEWPAKLSGGQKQRAALARALVSQPRALALDEPLGALDALTRVEMQNLLEAVWKRDGFTAVLVTHDVSEAVRLADRILLIEDGAIALDLDLALPRPRERGSVAVAQLEEQILRRLMRSSEFQPEYSI
jgi:sulfonate transport system ATP-binding protein